MKLNLYNTVFLRKSTNVRRIPETNLVRVNYGVPIVYILDKKSSSNK